MSDIAQVLRNVADARYDGNIGKAINKIAHTANGTASQTLESGGRIVNGALRGVGPDPEKRCQQLQMAMAAALGVALPDIPSTYNQWGGGPLDSRVTGDYIRHGDSYFFHR